MYKAFLAIAFCVASVASAVHCTYDKKDPKGTQEEQMIKSFNYTLSAKKKRLTLTNIKVTKEGKDYAAEGEEWPDSDKGTLNPAFGKGGKKISDNHIGFKQYKKFEEINEDVLWARFEVMIKGDVVRIPIVTNDGNWTEEVFTCE